jgi:uncharacterized membrane protein
MSVVARTLERTETIERLDAPAGAAQRLLRRLLPDRPGITAALGGSWIGHPLHPILVLTPIGTWLSASVLDQMPGAQAAARRLVATGVLAAVPAAITGAMDYRRLEGPQRRTGFLHLLSNLTATTLYAASYRARCRGHTGTGQVLGLLGLVAVGTGGTLGGHLSYAQGVGVYRWQPDRAAMQQPGQPEVEPAAPPRAPVGRSTWP